jgi:putative FmdB family regulatory protein
MPIYEFECARCGNRFERLQKLSDPDPSACPECGAGAVQRRLNAPAFRLAGSGWYETDFKKAGDKKRNLADRGEASGGEKKTDGATTAGEGAGKAASEAKPPRPAEAGTAAPAG